MTVLIVEDDVLLNKGITHMLTKEGYVVRSSHTYEEGFSYTKQESIDLILLDINLKGKSGVALCQEIRKYSQVPIIFITARDTEQDMIEGFDAGCDDYIAKPFSLEVLKKRVEALLRRVAKDTGDIFRDGRLCVDYSKKSVTKNSEAIKLTVTEYKIVEMLTKNKGQVLTRDMILDKLWDVDGNFVEANTLSVHMRRLRMKLEENPKEPKWVVTVFGIGYTWGE